MACGKQTRNINAAHGGTNQLCGGAELEHLLTDESASKYFNEYLDLNPSITILSDEGFGERGREDRRA